MTICITAICDNYKTLVLASDSMLTSPMLEFEQPTKKMTPLSSHCIAMTAGNALAHTELFNSVRCSIEVLKSPPVSQIVEKIKACYQLIRKREICERILKPKGFDGFEEFWQAQRIMQPDISMNIQFEINSYDYELSIITAGISNDRAQVYSIEDPGTSQCYDSIGFHAIGSGFPHAINALTARVCHQNLPLEEVFMIVYEAKKMAERAPGVGLKSNFTIINDKKITNISEEAIDKLPPIYEKWLRKDEDWKKELESTII